MSNHYYLINNFPPDIEPTTKSGKVYLLNIKSVVKVEGDDINFVLEYAGFIINKPPVGESNA